MEAIIPYPGSKWKLAVEIVNLFPEHRAYVEPFFGSGAVLFNKPRSPIETINDLDGDVVNFFQWVKNDPEKLAYEIHFTPYARITYESACDKYNIEQDSFQQAVNFCIRLSMGYGFRTTGQKSGWKYDVHGREAAYAAKNWAKKPDILLKAAERLRGVQIECCPAVDLIRKNNYPDVLIYADPPYLFSTRAGKQYKKEMQDRDHMELLDALKAHKGQVVLSGYASDLYDSILGGWYQKKFKSFAQNGAEREEKLWMNFDPPITLFDMLRR